MASQRDKNIAFNILLAIGCVVAAIWMFAGGGKAASDMVARGDIKAVMMDQWRTEDRLQKQLDDLRQRVEKLEARQ